jgi:iron complex transport system substrate-binding protein
MGRGPFYGEPMRIVSLEPFLTDLIGVYGLDDALVGISHGCTGGERVSSLPRLTRARPSAAGRSKLVKSYQLESSICSGELILDAIIRVSPDLILTSVPAEAEVVPRILANAAEDLAGMVGHEVRILCYNPTRLDEIYAVYERLGKDLGAGERGLGLAQRQKAQFMDWADSFYERMKNKRVTFLSGVEPLMLAGLWIPDMIRLASGVSQMRSPGQPAEAVEWGEIVQFRPDVLVVAPEGVALSESCRKFRCFEKLPDWEQLPAAKRGEVFFSDGLTHFYRPGPGLVESMAILLSAMAGFESGYITPRESFYKLRWLEVQRHRFQ